MIIDWSAPSDQGTPILGYNIYFKKSDNTFVTELVDCDGSVEQIITTTECTVPLATLTALPFELLLGDQIQVRLTAYNAYGESAESEIGGGGLIQLVPDPPINLANDMDITLDDRIGITWDDGHSNGGNSIIDYQIWYD